MHCASAGISMVVEGAAEEAARAVTNGLTARTEMDTLQKAFQVLQVKPWFDISSDRHEEIAFKAEARKSIEVLKAQYAVELPLPFQSDKVLEPLVKAEQLDAQFDSLAERLESRAGAADSTIQCWSAAFSNHTVIGRYISSYCKLAGIMLILPSTSVENERQFSLMSMLKYGRRNKLGPKMLNALCRLKRSPLTVKTFPYGEGLAQWKRAAVRRGV